MTQPLTCIFICGTRVWGCEVHRQKKPLDFQCLLHCQKRTVTKNNIELKHNNKKATSDQVTEEEEKKQPATFYAKKEIYIQLKKS